MFNTKFVLNKIAHKLFFGKNAIAVFGAMFFVLSGCVGFTEDFLGSSCSDASEASPVTDSKLFPRFNAARHMQSGTVSVNENNDSVTIVLETYGGCTNKGGKFEWNDDFYFADTTKYAYRFQGDTLLLTKPYIPDEFEANQDTFDVTLILVDGNPGVLEGIWLMTQCQIAKGKTTCYDDGYDRFVAFDVGSVEYRIQDRDDYDYMSSVFVEGLFIYLDVGQQIPVIENVFYKHVNAKSLDDLSKEYNVEVLEKTNESMKFAYDGHTFKLKLEYAAFMDSVAVSLSSGDVTCKGSHVEMRDASTEMCRIENEDYLHKEDSGAYSYSKGNDAEFERCIDSILGRGND